MSLQPQRIQSIFLAAAEKPVAERDALLDRECNGDPDLRCRVEALLQHHDQPGSFLDAPPAGVAFTQIRAIVEQPGDQIGPYKLIEQIGEGGFGMVYLVQQERPVRRRAALKVINSNCKSDRRRPHPACSVGHMILH